MTPGTPDGHPVSELAHAIDAGFTVPRNFVLQVSTASNWRRQAIWRSWPAID